MSAIERKIKMIEEKSTLGLVKLSDEELITVKGGSIVITTGALIGAGLAAAGLGVGFYFGHK